MKNSVICLLFLCAFSGFAQNKAATDPEPFVEPCASMGNDVINAYDNAGQALADLAGMVDTMPAQDLTMAMSNALTVASSAFDNLASLLVGYQEENPDVSTEEINLYLSMSAGLQNVSFSLMDGNFDMAYAQMGQFSADLEAQVANGFQDVPDAEAAFNDANSYAAQTTSILGMAAPTGSQDAILELMSEAVAESQNLADMETTAAEILALTDPELRTMMGLDDPEAIDELNNIVATVTHPEAQEAFVAMSTDPMGYVNMLVTFGAADSLALLGTSLTTAASVLNNFGVFAFCGLCDCPNECDTDDDCMECYHCATGIGTGSASPKDLEDYELTLEIVTRAPRMTPGAGGGVRKAMKNLIKLLKFKRPTLWIKVCWEDCDKVSCWVLWDRRKCVAKTSGWAKVPAPYGLPYWPAVSSWSNSSTKKKIDKAIADKTAEECKGK